MAGAKDFSCKAYRGGIDLGYSERKLVESVESYIEEGFNAVKIKVGHPELSTDLARVKAVREAIGPKKNLYGRCELLLYRKTGDKCREKF